MRQRGKLLTLWYYVVNSATIRYFYIHKPNHNEASPKTIASSAAVLLLIPFFILNNSHSAYASANGKLSADSSANVLKERQVLLSQQLFVVKLSKAKKITPKKTNVDFKAELKDAFMIVCYENGKSYTELKWAMCPEGACPISGTFKSGTPQYKHHPMRR